MIYSPETLRETVKSGETGIPIYRCCELLGLSRSTYYYEPAGETAYNEELMRLMDRQYLETPFYGARRMWAFLRRLGHEVNLKRVRRLMRRMGLETIYPKGHKTTLSAGHRTYPYLLRGVVIDHPDQVWGTDIAYVPLSQGFLYIVVILDWHSRYVLSWRLSNTLDVSFCEEALAEALSNGKPEIFNSDQGSQFTSERFQKLLKEAKVQISMDGRGRAYDNIFVERFWRSYKYEEVYLHAYEGGREASRRTAWYMSFYNEKRPHQSLDYRAPAEVYRSEGGSVVKGRTSRARW